MRDQQYIARDPAVHCLTPAWCAAASRTCQLSGKKANNGYVGERLFILLNMHAQHACADQRHCPAVTFSHKRNKKLQGVNLQYKRLFWPEAKRWVRLRLSTKAMKTVEKKGLALMAKEAGLDLYRLPFEAARPQRLEWLAQQPKQPPMVPLLLVLLHSKFRQASDRIRGMHAGKDAHGQLAAHEEPGEAGGQPEAAAGRALHHRRPRHPHARPGLCGGVRDVSGWQCMLL